MKEEFYEPFVALMNEYNSFLDGLISLEDEKIKAVAAEDLEGLNQCMRREEAEMLRMRGMDQKRDKLLAQMGMAGKTFGNVVESATAAHQGELQPLHTLMQEKTERLKGMAASIKNMLEAKLDKIDMLTGKGSGGAYAPDGRRAGGGATSVFKDTQV